MARQSNGNEDPWREAWLDAPYGTETSPVEVTSAFSERIVGVTDPDDDSLVRVFAVEYGPTHDLVWAGREDRRSYVLASHLCVVAPGCRCGGVSSRRARPPSRSSRTASFSCSSASPTRAANTTDSCADGAALPGDCYLWPARMLPADEGRTAPVESGGEHAGLSGGVASRTHLRSACACMRGQCRM